MKKLVLLALVVIMLPAIASAQNPGIKQGDPGFYFNFPGGTIPVVEGESFCDHLYAGNFYWASTLCGGLQGAVDTFAVLTSDLLGWPITHTTEGNCVILNDTAAVGSAWYFTVDLCITVPCDGSAIPGQLNTFSVQMAYCDGSMTAQPDSGDCEDPNVRSGPVDCYSTITQNFEVLAPAPPLQIFQDTLYIVEEGVTSAYIPFSICNGDLCAGTGDYDYKITSLGNIGAAIVQTGTVSAVGPGDCVDVYGLLDAGAASVCTYDTLTILAWDVATGLTYDTCVQAVHVVEPIPVPLFTAPVVTILVLAMILAAAVIMKRHAISKV
jgi:hypothetical protein